MGEALTTPTMPMANPSTAAASTPQISRPQAANLDKYRITDPAASEEATAWKHRACARAKTRADSLLATETSRPGWSD